MIRGREILLKLEGLPPIQSPEAERALLGAMLSQPDDVIDMATEQLTKEDFFNAAHQILFQVLVDMRQAAKGIDLATVTQWLDDRKLADVTGGPALLGDLAAGVVSVMTAPAHIATVRDKSTLRGLQQAAAQIAYMTQERAHECPEVVDEAERLVFGIAERSLKRTTRTSREAVLEAVDLIQRLAESRGRCDGIASGFGEIDELTTGFKPGEMIVVAARPGVGKTAFALSMAKNMLKERYDVQADRFVKPGHAVGMFSLEMTTQQLMLRMLASHASLSLQKIRKGQLSGSDLVALSAVADEVSLLPLFIDESSVLSINQLRAKARRMVHQHGVEVIIIDYLQLLISTSEKAKDNRQVEVAEISRGIKALSLELKIPIIVLAQLNRKPEEGNHEPALHHLRESGSIEQDADVVMMLSRVAGEENQAPGGALRARLNIAKQRNGPTDKIDLFFLSEFTRFESIPRSNGVA
jgi:replicative DNA helicase